VDNQRRLSSPSWNYAQRGLTLDCEDWHIALMAGIRNSHARPPVQKEAVAEDIIAIIETLDRGTLRGLRDRAMLLIGYAGGLRRSEIVGLDLKQIKPKMAAAGSRSSTRRYLLVTLRFLGSSPVLLPWCLTKGSTKRVAKRTLRRVADARRHFPDARMTFSQRDACARHPPIGHVREWCLSQPAGKGGREGRP
jgi:integrase